MYQPYRIIPRDEINELAAIAYDLIPTACAGSFIVEFPRLPSRFEPERVRQLRLVGLLPSQQIALHADVSIAPAVRHHVCLRTNTDCWSFSEGKWVQLYEGLVYLMDPAIPHGAVNWGTTNRLHLMIDVEG